MASQCAEADQLGRVQPLQSTFASPSLHVLDVCCALGRISPPGQNLLLSLKCCLLCCVVLAHGEQVVEKAHTRRHAEPCLAAGGARHTPRQQRAGDSGDGGIDGGAFFWLQMEQLVCYGLDAPSNWTSAVQTRIAAERRTRVAG